MSSQIIPDVGRHRLRGETYAPTSGSCPRIQPSILFNLEAGLRVGLPHGSHHDGTRGRLRESGGRSARGTGMMAGSDGDSVAGGSARHVPVLGRPALELLNVRDGGI